MWNVMAYIIYKRRWARVFPEDSSQKGEVFHIYSQESLNI